MMKKDYEQAMVEEKERVKAKEEEKFEYREQLHNQLEEQVSPCSNYLYVHYMYTCIIIN